MKMSTKAHYLLLSLLLPIYISIAEQEAETKPLLLGDSHSRTNHEGERAEENTLNKSCKEYH